MHRGLRIPHLRKGDDSPLRIWLLHWIRNACHTQRLPTPRRRRYGHNVTSPTRLRHSTAEWFTRSLRLCSRDARCVRAISRGTCVEICDAVRLGLYGDDLYELVMWLYREFGVGPDLRLAEYG